MTAVPPAYFESVRRKAAARWDQLESDPELAGPWHQLFKQVQSPRHVVSELLQNADDAGAREAAVWIEDGAFVFEHDGEDFTEEHFASLCRFGYSNKRDLHTIGFRGIGFKSTFSVGDLVEVRTPTLSVCFDRHRFTEPRWSDAGRTSDGKTRTRVVIKDEHRLREVQKNLEEWRQSALSLLFFKHIRCLRVADATVQWATIGPGPVAGSEWMSDGDQHGPILRVRSEAEPFPDECLEEILQERLVTTGERADYPPCRVEIVLGGTGRLFVVLPTGVETALPFACNAPFIQDPARLKIKDPNTSPTNRWLLGRVGRLAAAAMVAWLSDPASSEEERAAAYDLMPDVNRKDNSLPGVCATMVELAFEQGIENELIVLTDGGLLVASGKAVAVPVEITDVWPPRQAGPLFDERGRPGISRHVGAANRQKLLNWNAVDDIGKQKVLLTLRQKRLPLPDTWDRLAKLWAYVAPDFRSRLFGMSDPEALRIMPAEGKEVLFAADEVVRLGEKRLLASEDDWQFLADHLLVLHHGWLRFLTDRGRSTPHRSDDAALTSVNAVQEVLDRLGLSASTDVNKLIDRAAAAFFRTQGVSIADCVRFAHIAAKLDVTVGANFRYVTRDTYPRAPEDHVLFDPDGRAEEFVPEAKRDRLLLHAAYSRAFTSCTREEWTKWAASSRSGLLSFPPLVNARRYIAGRQEIEAELRVRGVHTPPVYAYNSSVFILSDWDFGEDMWRHWQELADEDNQPWGAVAERLVAQPKRYWHAACNAEVFHEATNGYRRQLTIDPLLPSWVLRLRDLPCLRDTQGFCRKPADLLRRTPETEPLMDVEAFVHSSLDNEATRPLLDLLGVQSTPTGPDRLLNRLRALAQSDRPPVHEVERWYRRLDQMVDTCSTQDLEKIKGAFHSEKLILSHTGEWATVATVFLTANEEDVPDAPIVRESVQHLNLWRRLGVADRPTADLAIRWLKQLPKGQKLSSSDQPRVRAPLARYPVRIWEDCGAWISLSGEWVAVEGLSYALTMQSLLPWGHLHTWVKDRTADLQRLRTEISREPPFSALTPLAACLEERIHRDPGHHGEPEERPWLRTLAMHLRRIELENEQETQRVRGLARQLAVTRWQRAPGLETIPYIDGTPAGLPRRVDVLWLDTVLYVDELSTAKLAKRVPEEIGKAFDLAEIKEALLYSFERTPDDVRAYLEENFRLAAADPTDADAAPAGARESGRRTRETEEARAATRTSAPDGDFEDDGDFDGTDDDEGWLFDDEEDLDDDGEEPKARRRAKKAPKPGIMERFAALQGFRHDGNGRFRRDDGSWIAKAPGDLFPWQLGSPSGEVLRRYWPREHCLFLKPLEIEAEVWALLDSSPEQYALVLEDLRGDPVEIAGPHLRELREQERLRIYPAAYRLVLEGDVDA